MSAEWCGAHVREAVAQINEAAGREVLAYGGTIQATPAQVSAAVAAGAIPVWTDTIKSLGLTNFNFDERKGAPDCVGVALVRLSRDLQTSSAAVAQICVTHELLHAIGAAHAEPGVYRTIMAPSADSPNMAGKITRWDANAIRYMYGD
jgi:hypothetical protein